MIFLENARQTPGKISRETLRTIPMEEILHEKLQEKWFGNKKFLTEILEY